MWEISCVNDDAGFPTVYSIRAIIWGKQKLSTGIIAKRPIYARQFVDGYAIHARVDRAATRRATANGLRNSLRYTSTSMYVRPWILQFTRCRWTSQLLIYLSRCRMDKFNHIIRLSWRIFNNRCIFCETHRESRRGIPRLHLYDVCTLFFIFYLPNESSPSTCRKCVGKNSR